MSLCQFTPGWWTQQSTQLSTVWHKTICFTEMGNKTYSLEHTPVLRQHYLSCLLGKVFRQNLGLAAGEERGLERAVQQTGNKRRSIRMKRWENKIIKHKQNPKLSEHYIQVQLPPLRHSYKNSATWTHHYTSGHGWFPVLGRVQLPSTRGLSETTAELTPVSALCATNLVLMLEKPCSLLPLQPPPRSYPVSINISVNLTVYRAGNWSVWYTINLIAFHSDPASNRIH